MPAHNIAQTTPTSWARPGHPLGKIIRTIYSSKGANDELHQTSLQETLRTSFDAVC